MHRTSYIPLQLPHSSESALLLFISKLTLSELLE